MTTDQIAALKAAAEKVLQKMEAPQLRKIHPLDVPLEVFLADLTRRPANIIRAELAGFVPYAGTGTFDIEPPFTVRHLCMFSRSEMRKWPNFGRKCLNEVEEMLRARGLQLWENHDERSLRLLREHKEYFTLTFQKADEAILALIARLEAAERDANKWRDNMANRNRCYDRRYVAQITIEGVTKSGDMLSASRVVDREMWDRSHINEIAVTAEAAAAWFDAAMLAEDGK